MILIATFAGGGLRAQKVKITPDDLALADLAASTFEKEEAVYSKAISVYTFSYDKKSDAPVSATLSVKNSLIATGDECKSMITLFGNEQTTYQDVKRFRKKGRADEFVLTWKSYQSADIFHDDVVFGRFRVDLEEKGDLVSYSYNANYKDVKYLTSVYFPEMHGLLEKEVSIIVPQWLEVTIMEFNMDGKDFEKEESLDKDGSTIYKYTIRDLPAFSNESNQPGLSKTYPHLILIFNAYEWDGVTHNLMSETKDLYQWYVGLVKEVGNETTEIEPKVKALIKGKVTDKEKIEAIFYWVQDNIRYIAFENGIMGFKPAAAQEVYTKKYGDCKGMANLTKEMLLIAGYDARLTWLGTRSLAYDYSLPSLAVDNHMICTVVLDTANYYLDPTEDFIGFGQYAERIQGRPVLIENGEEFILDKVPAFDHKHNTIEQNINLKVKDDMIVGSATFTFNGEEGTRIRRGLNSVKTDMQDKALRKYLAGGDKNVQFSNIRIKNLPDRNEALFIACDIALSNQLTNVGEEVYLNFDFLAEMGHMKLKKDRQHDYEFPYKMNIVGSYQMEIPQGYKLDYLPKAVKVSNEEFAVDIGFQELDGKVMYKKHIIIHDARITKDNFTEWNACVDLIKEIYNDQVILKN